MKNRLLKKTVSLILAAMLLFLIPSTAFAASGDEGETVAKAYYFCYVKAPGHCWIYVENLTDEAMTVGLYEVEPYGGVSVGTFGHTRYDGWGIYYNVEAYSQTTYGMGKYVTLSEELTKEELSTLSNAVKSYGNKWSWFKNCTAFAANVWNTVSDTKMSAQLFPAFVRISLFFKPYSTNTPVMKPVDKENVLRQVGDGDGAYLKPVSKLSLREIV